MRDRALNTFLLCDPGRARKCCVLEEVPSLPRPISWLHRAPDIRRALLGSARSHYGRRDIERLFELQPRAAQQLMAALPATPVGTSTLVERDGLVALIDAVTQAEDPAATLAGFRERKRTPSKRTLRSLMPHNTEPAEWDNLPGGLTLAPGLVRIEFQSLETLCLCLLSLASLLERQTDEFADRYEVRLPALPLEDGKAEVASLFAELERMEAERLKRS